MPLHRQGVDGIKKGRKDSHSVPQPASTPQPEKEPLPIIEDLPLVGLQYHLRAGQHVWFVMKGRPLGRIPSTRPPTGTAGITRPKSGAMLDVFMRWMSKTALVPTTEEGGQGGKYCEGEF